MPPGMAATMRQALGSTLGRTGGRQAPTWGIPAPELGELLASSWGKGAGPRALGPMATRLAKVSDLEVRQVVELGELEDSIAAPLAATLLGRRDQVARQVLGLIAGANPAR